MSLRRGWDEKDQGPERAKKMREEAEYAVRARDAKAERRMVETHETAMRMLAREHKQISDEKAQQPNLKRYHEQLLSASDAMRAKVTDQKRKDNGFLGRAERLFGGKNRQDQRLHRIEKNHRDQQAKLSVDYDRREAQRQAALKQRLTRIEADQHKREKDHPKELEQMRTQRAAGFEHAVQQELHHQRQLKKQGRGR